MVVEQGMNGYHQRPRQITSVDTISSGSKEAAPQPSHERAALTAVHSRLDRLLAHIDSRLSFAYQLTNEVTVSNGKVFHRSEQIDIYESLETEISEICRLAEGGLS